MGISDQALYKILLDSEFVEQAKLDEVLDIAQKNKTSLYDEVLQKDLMSDENLGRLIADFYKIPFVVLSKVAIDDYILHIVPQKVASAQKVVAFDQTKKGIKVATSNPESVDVLEMIAKKTGGEIILYYATPRDIDDSMRYYKKELQKSFDDLLAEQVNVAGKVAVKEAPVSKIVDLLIEYAYQNKASDIHIEPSDIGTLVRFRIDGVLHDVLNLPNDLHEQVATRIKVLSKLRTDEHMSAQDGKMQIKLPEEDLDIRVSIVPIVEGEKIVLRLLSSKSRQFGLRDLGMNDSDLKKVKNGFEKPYGMILSTGPTGSGKTTSMYSILKILNTRDVNIATIEDPVEYDIAGLNQIQVNAKTNLTFVDGLRAILRQDPNIIYVGEIRDEETADIAINSAMTGHLVLSTLHTNDAATSLPRLIDMGVEPFLVASTVNVIVGQRLVRKICDKCKVSISIPVSEISKHIQLESIKKHFGENNEIRAYHGKGCPVCHLTGYSGRVGIFEVLEVSPEIQVLINNKVSSDQITKKAIEEGMSTMTDDGLDKVQRGVTTIEEILRATKEQLN